MSTGLTAATTTFMGDSYTFIDCPGSVEFIHDMRAALPAVDAAVVVCEADETQAAAAADDPARARGRSAFRASCSSTRSTSAEKRVRETLATLQPASRVPLVLRQIPIWKGELIAGFVDLALERAFIYREHMPSEVVELEGGDLDREKEARFSMLEKLADHDDALMEQLLEDIQPPRDAVFDDLPRELREGLICPVLLGSATRANGVLRLLKALRHEAPGVAETAKRLGVPPAEGTLAYVIKTVHVQHGGKPSLVRRVVRPSRRRRDAAVLSAARRTLLQHSRASTAPRTTSVGAPRPATSSRSASSTSSSTGDTLSDGKTAPPALCEVEPAPPVLAMALAAADRKDDVKLGQSLLRLSEEDPSLTIVHNPRHPRDRAVGAGRDASARRAGAAARTALASVSTSARRRSAIAKPSASRSTQRGRHKKQSGGHGQFGDVVLEIKALPRGEGFKFDERWSAARCRATTSRAVEEGVVDALLRGPLGFPVVDIAVTLTDGSYHTVDSSDLAFRTAARIGVSEALPECQPVLLEPIHTVEIVCPTDATAKINAILSGAARTDPRRSTPAKAGRGWDVVRAMLPEAEIGDLIIELRSATAGAGSFTRQFDHMAEVTGRTADQIVAAHRDAA